MSVKREQEEAPEFIEGQRSSVVPSTPQQSEEESVITTINNTHLTDILERLTQFESQVVVERLSALESGISSLKKELAILKLLIHDIKGLVTNISVTQEEFVSDMEAEGEFNVAKEQEEKQDMLKVLEGLDDMDDELTDAELRQSIGDKKSWN
jgi:DNA-directed RNA polymerase sigma subunit (sigma70/sigma32)